MSDESGEESGDENTNFIGVSFKQRRAHEQICRVALSRTNNIGARCFVCLNNSKFDASFRSSRATEMKLGKDTATEKPFCPTRTCTKVNILKACVRVSGSTES
jgi:hypothetical protein